MEKYNNYIKKITELTYTLWQGKGINIEEMTTVITNFITDLEFQCGRMRALGIEFPMEYVEQALKNMKTAIDNRDDYLLADCLYYEWREIMVVFIEVAEEIK